MLECRDLAVGIDSGSRRPGKFDRARMLQETGILSDLGALAALKDRRRLFEVVRDLVVIGE